MAVNAEKRDARALTIFENEDDEDDKDEL